LGDRLAATVGALQRVVAVAAGPVAVYDGLSAGSDVFRAIPEAGVVELARGAADAVSALYPGCVRAHILLQGAPASLGGRPTAPGAVRLPALGAVAFAAAGGHARGGPAD